MAWLWYGMAGKTKGHPLSLVSVHMVHLVFSDRQDLKLAMHPDSCFELEQ